jgi:hypothetical protein
MVLSYEPGSYGSEIKVAATVAEQLRQVWNARGAADLATIEAALAVQPPSMLDQIRTLDR